MPGNVVFITVDQWRGDALSCVGHPLLRTPTIDGLAARGVMFANHWANTAPCGPSRATLYTGMYAHNHRSVLNGTPLDARFTNIALEARAAGYDPVLFGYTDTTIDPRTVGADDPRLFSYEGVLPGFRAVVDDPQEAGTPAWGRWLAAQGVDVPSDVRSLYLPRTDVPGADGHGATWAPTRFAAEHTETAFMVSELLDWLERHGDEPFFVHASFIRPHPPYRNPIGYHDLYDADDVGDFAGHVDRADEQAVHPLARMAIDIPGVGCPVDERDRRQLRATYHGMQREVDDQLGRLFGFLERSGLAGDTLVVLTSDHGEMGGDHWLIEKLGYWDESYHVPLVVVDPRPAANAARGRTVRAFTEHVDVMPTICSWLGIDVPSQCDGRELQPFLSTGAAPHDWRNETHWEWDFRDPRHHLAEDLLGIPMEHCNLAVVRGERWKYVQFAADPAILPPLLFDLHADPGQLVDLAADDRHGGARADAASSLLRWRMRHDERTLTGHLVTADEGLVERRQPRR